MLSTCMMLKKEMAQCTMLFHGDLSTDCGCANSGGSGRGNLTVVPVFDFYFRYDILNLQSV